MTDHCFISYSTTDAPEFARRLADELEGGEDKFVDAWLDKRDIDPGRDWDDQIGEAIQTCKCMVFVMTTDSVASTSVCKKEWNWALKCKKVVIPIRLQPDVEQPFGLGNRHWIDFTGEFEAGLAKLRLLLRKMDSPEGQLQALKDRLADAHRDLHRARKEEDKPRIKAEIDELTEQIKRQEEIVRNPKAAEEKTEKNIQSGLERERQPEKPVAGKTSTRFINPPPGIAPPHFQDRYFETEQIADFLKNHAQRLMTVIGRGGIGKTATICRLLKDLERGMLPDELGEMQVDGIIYLSETGSHKINFANIFYDLCKLLPTDAAQTLDSIYKNPQGSTESKTQALLDHFQDMPVILLLDNFEPLVSEEQENLPLRDAELDEALRAFLNGPHTAVKVIITTRVPPKALNSIQPGRQRIYHLEAGLEPKYAGEMLRQMDKDGILGLKNAKEDMLQRAHERTRGFPKALEALFQILSSDRYTTLEELFAMPTPYDVVEALVGEAFNRLDPSAQKVMQALAVYNRPVSPAAIDYLLQPHLPSIDSALALNRLVNMHFTRREAGRYYLHPADKEYAFSIIPVEELLTTKDTKVTKENQEQADEEALRDIQRELDSLRASRSTAFTQHDLLNRAADYFAQARKPRTDWKKLDDLSAQLAEFELRCEAGDHDTAADVITTIDFEYLFPWGHYRLAMEMNGRLQGKIQDKKLGGTSAGNLGSAHLSIGNIHTAIFHYQQALENHHEILYRRGEGVWLGNLGIAHATLGEDHEAIKYYERALVILREVGDQENESMALTNIGHVWLNLKEFGKAEDDYKPAMQIADKTLYSVVQLEARWGLAKVYFFQNDLANARTTIEAALQYDVPDNNHNVTALYGIIALRQGERETAQEAFTKSIAQADEILAKTPDYYSALDAKGLALCGKAISGNWGLVSERDEVVAEAVETFRKARKIAPHAGVVKSVLRLFDELVKCDEEGVLKGVREVIARVERG